MIKNEEYVSHNMFFIEEEKTDRITVPFRDLLIDIAEKSDNMIFFKVDFRFSAFQDICANCSNDFDGIIFVAFSSFENFKLSR